MLPLHPSNVILYPTLNGIWPHYQRYEYKQLKILASPTASLLAGGNVVLNVIPPNVQDDFALSIPSFT